MACSIGKWVALPLLVALVLPIPGRAEPTGPSNQAAGCPAVPLAVKDRVGCNGWYGYGNQPEGSCLRRGCCFAPTPRPEELKSWCYFPPGDQLVRAVDITRVMVVSGCHFDAGFATGFANPLTITQAINRWFDVHFVTAYRTGMELAANLSLPQLKFMAQSWLVSLYLDCPAGLGLHCPSAAAVDNFTTAVRQGWITWHAFPHNAEAPMLGADLFQAGIALTHSLDARFGLPPKVTLSQRDVPGITRAVVPLLAANGVRAISIGVNGGTAPANVPEVSRWVDEATSTSVLLLFQGGGYDGISITEPFDAIIVSSLSLCARIPPLFALCVYRLWAVSFANTVSMFYSCCAEVIVIR